MRTRGIFWFVIAILVIAAGVALAWHYHNKPDNNAPQAASNSAAQTVAQTTQQGISHVVIILEENKPSSSVVGSTDAPYINSLIGKYSFADNYDAITHPSLPNYIALTSGTTAGINSDCSPSSCLAKVTNITDELRQAGRSWKEYAESMPTPCDSTTSGKYAVKHNPFMYYPDITSDTAYCDSHVVPFTQFNADLASASALPNYSFVTPNLCNDMHDCSLKIGDDWLAAEVPKILNSPAFTTQKSLLVITWDEGSHTDNHIPTIFAGSAAKPGYKSNTHYSHYSLLRTIENIWGLAPMTKNDSSAPIMTDMLR
ncbi:MAG TPA: alkaline phosphatase family protein [Candidatus Saccharimonadales bacterium]|nr:alkaline phosphatase family protein [Candidatus Saccharimonadales bacterium]